jgi:SAM-dependent methyltransferase
MGEGGRRTVTLEPGSADSLQRAIDELGGPGTVFLAPGEHVLESTVTLHSGVSLVGAGRDRTTVTLAPGSNCHMFTNDDHQKGTEDIEFRGFSLEGNIRTQERPPDATGVTFACGAYLKRVRRVVVADVAAHGIRQTAFHFNHCVDVDVYRFDADELGWSGLSTSTADNIVIRNVSVTNSGLDVRHSGIHLDGGRRGYVDAVIDGCTGNGVMLDSTFSPLSEIVVRSVARHSLRGLSLSGDPDSELRNIQILGEYSDNRECGILVSNASDVWIIDVTLASNATAGLIVQGREPKNCFVGDCRITGSPQDIVERNGKVVRVGDGIGESAVTSRHPVDALREFPQRVRGKLKAQRKAKERARALAKFSDSYDGTCNICGAQQRFVRSHKWLREGYPCTACKAILRYRGQADLLLRYYSTQGSRCIAELTNEPDFKELAVWEPGQLGPFRAYFGGLPNYVESDFWPDVAPGDERDGIRCEDLMALTFAADSFDLVVTSDIFEHVRKPYIGFAEVHRVLRPGGRHIFSIPAAHPVPPETIERVDTSGDEDVFTLEPRYHLGPNRSQHLVYNVFGLDLIDRLAELGLDTEIVRYQAGSAEASRLVTFCSAKRGAAGSRP